MVVGVEVCGGRGGGVWEECGGRARGVWLEGWSCTVGGVEVCGRGGVLVGWRCVGGIEECGWSDEVCCGRGEGVW